MKMRRGDHKTFTIIRKDKNKNVIMAKPKKMYITYKYGDENNAVFQKTLNNGIVFDENTGVYTVKIFPEDTNKLPFGKLKYDIEIIKDNDEVKTIEVGMLEILEEVTYAINEV